MKPDLWPLYALMLRSRLFEIEVRRLWNEGLISGEMHLGMGEEAIAAGIVSQLQKGDALALDHRGAPPLLMRGVDATRLLKEFLGKADGLCRGNGGHMHLFSEEHLAVSSGIVGASGPAASGFALSGRYLRPESVSVAFFGDGAVNQGMMLESMNLAAAWKLPVIFVCKDNEWAITTKSESVTGGTLLDRANGFGLHAIEVDGADVLAVWDAAHKVIERTRNGEGASFILAHCIHIEGHFLGDALLGMFRKPTESLGKRVVPMMQSMLKREGASLKERLGALKDILGTAMEARKQTADENDPILRAREILAEQDPARVESLEEGTLAEIENIVAAATQ